MGQMGPISRISPIRAWDPRKLLPDDAQPPTATSINNMESGSTERLDRLGQLPVAHQDVIGIERADW